MIFTGAMFLLKMGSVGKFLAKNWQMVLIVAMVGAVYWYHTDRTNTIHKLEQTIVSKNEEIAEIKLDLASCNGAINNQNEIIDTLKETGSQIIKEERLRAAMKITEIEARRRADLATLRTKPLAQSCEAAMEELLDFAIGEEK